MKRQKKFENNQKTTKSLLKPYDNTLCQNPFILVNKLLI